GTACFASSIDLTPLQAYMISRQRWILGQLFDHDRNRLVLDGEKQGENAIVGAEFINFIAVLLSNRLFKLAYEGGVLDDCSYSVLLDSLNGCARDISADPNAIPSINDSMWRSATGAEKELIISLGIAEGVYAPKRTGRPRKARDTEGKPGEKRRPGRPRGSGNRSEASSANGEAEACAAPRTDRPAADAAAAAASIQPVPNEGGPGPAPLSASGQSASDSPAEAPERRRGRPRKERPPEDGPRRGRGRPGKETPADDRPRRPRGRPRIHPEPDPDQPRRPRGRPRMHPERTGEPGHRGRPRKNRDNMEE
ncbi:MAG: hypothetical protein Q4F72_09320, partial [Desulfovibrionaceae bacterium]|nr:hypothetical protein [Desulfovibrionaceae bacterium]